MNTEQTCENDSIFYRNEAGKLLAKLTADESLIVHGIYERDSQRLDAKQRAIYKKLGLDIEQNPTEPTSILADNIKAPSMDALRDAVGGNTDDMRLIADNITIGAQPQPAGRAANPPGQPVTTPKPSIAKRLLMPALLATAIGGGGGLALGLGHILKHPELPKIPEFKDTDTRRVIRGMP